MLDLPFKQFPSGWFQVAWEGDIEPGETKPLRYFDRDLVLIRTESGRHVVADAHCPHMGAHLGYGGKVEGEDVRCPFHGWCYETKTGAVADVPYSDSPKKPNVGLKLWEVRETMRMILVWHDALGRPPSWDPPAWTEPTSDEFYYGPEVREVFKGVRAQPQVVIENVVDPAHQQYIHGAAVPSEFVYADPDGASFKIRQSMIFGARGRKTFLTSEPIRIELDIEAHGVGIGLVRFRGLDGSVIVHTSTPVDHDTLDMFSSIMPRRTPDNITADGVLEEQALKRIKHQMRQVEKDIIIWENMKYISQPPLMGAENPTYAQFRRWTWQFYPELEHKAKTKVKTLRAVS